MIWQYEIFHFLYFSKKLYQTVLKVLQASDDRQIMHGTHEMFRPLLFIALSTPIIALEQTAKS